MDEPARRLSRDAWLSWYWVWDGYFALGYVALVIALANEDVPAAVRAGSIACLTAMAAWYLAFRRYIATEVEEPLWRRRVFVGGLVVLLVAGVAIHSAMSFALFAVNPLVFMSLRLREAIAAAVPVNLVPPAAVALREGLGETFSWIVPMALLSVGAAVMIGTYIGRIVSQSEERAALIRELEQSRAEVARLSTQAERARIGAEIHDTLAQGFTSLVTLVQAAESELDSDPDKARRHLALAARTARENLHEARALVAGLTPSALGTGSLHDAIARQVDRLVEETGIQAGYRAEGDHRKLPTVLEVVLLRAVQESLTNVRKHSGASKVSICLRVNDSSVTLRVIDDGVGFDPGTALDGFGLRGMRNRAAQVGGTLSVDSRSGVTLVLEVPL